MKIRITFFLLWCLLFSFIGHAQNNRQYIIKGILPDSSLDGTYIFLSKEHLFLEKGGFLLDSVKVINGTFTFKGYTTQIPFLAEISGAEDKIGKVVIEPGKIDFVCTSRCLLGEVSGTDLNDAYNKAIILPYNRLRQADSLFNKKTQAVKAGTWTQLDEVNYQNKFPRNLVVDMVELEFQFMEKYLQYPDVILTMVYSAYSSYGGGEKMHDDRKDKLSNRIENILLALPDTYRERIYKESEAWERLTQEYIKDNPEVVEKIKKEAEYKEILPDSVQVGKPFLDFSGITLQGDTIALSRLIVGKELVLLDFWASWCGPCMSEMPMLDTLYRKYQSHGLEIIGISSDPDPLVWKKTIAKNHMKWLHLKQINDKMVSEAYGIYFIPYTILIDKEGKIVARNLRGKELWQEVERRLKD